MVDFSTLDRSGGGVVSRSELSRGFKSEFGSKIDEEEFASIQEAIPGLEMEFSDLRPNRNGEVSTSSLVSKLVRELDSDDSRGISEAEWEEGGGALEPEEPEVPEEAPFSFTDAQGSNETVSKREAAKSTIEPADLNETGALTRDEFDEAGLSDVLGADFDDINKTGSTISQKEMESFFAKLFRDNGFGLSMDEEEYEEIFPTSSMSENSEAEAEPEAEPEEEGP